MLNLLWGLAIRVFDRLTGPSRADLVLALDELSRVVEGQQLIVNAAEDLIDAMWLFDSKGNPAITVKCDNPVEAETLRHRIWHLQCLVEGQDAPAPIFIEGTYH